MQAEAVMIQAPLPNGRRPAEAVVDPVWSRILDEARVAAREELPLSGFLHQAILDQPCLEAAVIQRIADRLGNAVVSSTLIAQAFRAAITDEPDLGTAMRVDIVAVADRDPACSRYIDPVLYFKGFHALQTHRCAHWLLNRGRRDFALYLQSRASEVFQVDINPAARVGKGVFLDHGTGIVVGETAVIEDDVSILQGVTLGGTGKEHGDRHPKIRKGVLIGAGAKVLGNIEVGACSRIAAGSVVVKPVPPCTTVAGVPARVIGEAGCADPARAMDQMVRDGAGL